MAIYAMFIQQSAAGSSGSSGTRSSRERAVNLLRVVQNLLERNDDVEQGRQSSQDEAGPSPSGEKSSTRGEVVKNFRNLFASYSAASRSQSSRPPPAKRQKSLYVPKETWTHEFFCLADCARVDAPSRKEKLELQFAGLGRKKIVFGSKDSALQVKTKLKEEFPKLKDGGGFEILRSGFSPGKSLVLLEGPEGGVPAPLPSPFFSEIPLPCAQTPFPLAEFVKTPSVIQVLLFALSCGG